MKERPILFSGPMICAINEGRKTQTRRVLTDQYHGCLGGDCPHNRQSECDAVLAQMRPYYGEVGDRLWVRETWTADTTPEATRAIDKDREALWWHELPKQYQGVKNVGYVYYRADGAIIHPPMPDVDWQHLRSSWKPKADDLAGRKWFPSIFMPRWASRLTLEITRVRIEPLQNITPRDSLAEGVTVGCKEDHLTHDIACPVEAFERLWDSINFERAAWRTNPMVRVIDFKRVQP